MWRNWQSCNPCSTHRWGPEAQRAQGTQGHMDAKCLLHRFELAQAPRTRILGYCSFWAVLNDFMNRLNNTFVTHQEQRNFKKLQPGLLHHRTEWMIGIYSLFELNCVPLNLPVPQNVTAFGDRLFKEAKHFKWSQTGGSWSNRLEFLQEEKIRT